MSGTTYDPNWREYNGYRLLDGGCGNTTCRQILTDTSGRWQLTQIAGGIRTYTPSSQ